jgi:hypothetical protein
LEGKYSLKAKRIMFEKFCKKYLDDARINKKPKSQARPLAHSEYLFHDIEGDRITFLTKTFWKVIRGAGLIRTDLKNGESRKVRF